MIVHLFNAVIDLSLTGLGPELGTEIGGVRENHNAFDFKSRFVTS